MQIQKENNIVRSKIKITVARTMKKSQSNQDRIYQILLDNIKKGVYPQSQIMPSLRDLAKQLYSTPGTVRHALLKLQNDGFVTARRGSGYYVNKEFGGNKNNVLILERLTGSKHLFSSFINEFYSNFQQYPEYSIYLEDILRYQEQPDKLAERLKVYAKNLDAIFCNGEEMRILPTEVIAELHKHTKLYYYYRARHNAVTAGIPGVGTDWNHGQYIAIQHLIACGCRRILLCLLDFSRYDGAAAAVRDSGEDVTLIYAKNDDDFLKKMKTEKFDAIFCFQDYTAIKGIHRLRQLGYKIPGDIAVVGYYNTPWSTHPDCPITSVNICEEEMIRRIVDMFTGKREEEQILLLPKLEIRASTSEYKKNHERSCHETEINTKP